MRRAVLGPLCAAAVVLLTGLAQAALGPRYGGTLRVGVTALPASLEPALPETVGERLAGALVHETLVGVGPEGLPVPGLVSNWTSAAGGREWVLTLHAGARFHDDRAVTAEDALRSLRRFLRSPSRAAAWLAQSLDGGSAFRDQRRGALPGLALLDERRLVLRFPEPVALPLAPLASPLAAVTGPAGQGCGPFVPTLHVPGRQLTLNAFTGHVRGRPYLDEIDVRAQADAATLTAEWSGGRLDVAFDAALDARATPGAPTAPRAALLLLVLDPARPPFDLPDARQALAARLDRAALVTHFVPGGDAWSALLPPTLLSAPSPSPTPARVAGPATARLSLHVARDVAPGVSRRLVALLSEAGYEARVAAPVGRVARRAPADARLMLFVPEVPEAGLALAELAELAPVAPEVQADLAAAHAETRLDRRRALLIAAEQALRADGVRLALAVLPVGLAAGAGLHGASVDAGGRLRLEGAWREP